MYLPSTINDRYSAADYWLKAKVTEEEAGLPDYARPLKRLPATTNFIKGQVAIRAFAAQVHKETRNFLFSI